MRAPRVVIAALAAAVLAGCAADEPHGCALPELTPYDDAFMQRAADELLAAPQDSYLAEMVEDYGRLRAQIRALRGAPAD